MLARARRPIGIARSFLFCVCAACVLASGSFGAPRAWAQLPVPEFGDAPDLRLASADAFVDRLRTASQRITRDAAERKPAIETDRAQLKALLERPSVAVAPRFNPASARRLIDALDREEELRDAAVEILDRASNLAGQSATSLIESVTIDDIVKVAEDVRRQKARRRRRLNLAQQLRSLGTTPSRSESQDASPDAKRQQFRLQEAQADLAEAEGLEAEALVRLGQRQLAALRTAWSPDTNALEDAAKTLESAEKRAEDEHDKVRRIRARTATVTRARSNESDATYQARSSQLTAQLDQLSHREARADAKVARAQAKLAALQHQAGIAVDEAAPSANALMVDVASIERTISRIETRLNRMPSTSRSWRIQRLRRKERASLESSLIALGSTRQELLQALTYARIREAPSRIETETSRSSELGYTLTILVLIAALFLLTRGYRWGAQLLDQQRRLPPRLRLSKRQQARLRTLAVLLWPVFIAAGAAALLIWPVWGLSLSIGEALRLVDRPLFFIDETGVSILSVVKLAFAVYAASVLSTAVREFLRTRVYPQTDWDIGLTTALDTLVHYTTMSVGLIFGLRFVGVGFSALAILAGLLGIGIGFGLRNITENFISGLIILAERPIKIGDFIQLGPGDLEGQVRRIRARSTTVVTRDNISVIIPNSEFVAGRVTNWSHGDPKVRIAIVVGVAYGSDTHLVRKVLLEVAGRHGKVLDKPSPEVEFKAFGSSSLDFVLRGWIDQQVDRFRIASDLRFAIDASFRKFKIEIAFPQLDLHLKSTHEQLLDAVHQRPTPPAGANATNLDGPSSPEVG